MLATLLAFAAPAAAGGGGGHGEAAAGEHHEHLAINWVDFTHPKTPPIIAVALNFAILLFALVYFTRKPLADYLAERQGRLSKELDDAQIEAIGAEGKLRGAEMRARALDEELTHLRQDLLAVGMDERDRLVADAGVRAEKIRREAEAQVAEERRRAMVEERARAVETAVAEARRTLREKLSPQDHRRLADGFAKAIEEGKPS